MADSLSADAGSTPAGDAKLTWGYQLMDRLSDFHSDNTGSTPVAPTTYFYLIEDDQRFAPRKPRPWECDPDEWHRRQQEKYDELWARS